jgi:hypothetical protein
MSSSIREWPALMDLDTAGAYLTLAPGSLINLLRRENIAPVEVGARLRRWRRQDLDALLERLPRLASPRTFAAPPRGPEDEIDRALACVDRRAARRRKPVGPKPVGQKAPLERKPPQEHRPDEVRQSNPAP